MFQSVGSSLAKLMGECMGLPLYVRTISGTGRSVSSLEYSPTHGDEVSSDLDKSVKVRFSRQIAVGTAVQIDSIS